MSEDKARGIRVRRGPVRALVALVGMLLALVLGWSVLTLPEQPVDLARESRAALDESGVSNPVTAVLMNFRSYDTFLEIGVLLLAVICVWALRLPPPQESAPPRLLIALARLLSPIMVLVAAYLLWVGSSEPGGEFQSGAVLGALGVLLVLVGAVRSLSNHRGKLLAGLVAGYGVFLLVGVAVAFATGTVFEYPRDLAYTLIMTIEVPAAISIGLALAVLFFAAPPEVDE
jgi:multisubunit Na+/H+ antiporter MnhB subunit